MKGVERTWMLRREIVSELRDSDCNLQPHHIQHSIQRQLCDEYPQDYCRPGQITDQSPVLRPVRIAFLSLEHLACRRQANASSSLLRGSSPSLRSNDSLVVRLTKSTPSRAIEVLSRLSLVSVADCYLLFDHVFYRTSKVVQII
jgi:hypothetical protein